MPITQQFDKKRNPFKGTLYSGSGLHNSPKMFIDSDTDNDEFIGGFIEFGSLISNVGKIINDNKDTIQAVASTAGKVVDFGKATADAVKASKEADVVKSSKSKVIGKLTPEQELYMGNGFANFSKNKHIKSL